MYVYEKCMNGGWTNLLEGRNPRIIYRKKEAGRTLDIDVNSKRK
jgi:hypothetical protein